MVFGRSKSLRSKRSNVGATKEAIVDPAPRPPYVPTNPQPSSELNVLRTSMIFPDAPQEALSKSAPSGDDMHFLRSSLLFPGEGVDLSAYAPKVNVELSKAEDETSYAKHTEHSVIRPALTPHPSASGDCEAYLDKSSDRVDNSEMLIGMALGDPDEDMTFATREEPLKREPLQLKEPSPSPSFDPDTFTFQGRSTTSSSPMPRSDFLYPQDPSTTTTSSTTPLSGNSMEVRRAECRNDSPKPKPHRWHTLGALFGKKHGSPAQPSEKFYQIHDDSKTARNRDAGTLPKWTSHQRGNVPTNKESLGVVPKGKDRFHRNRSTSTRLTKSKDGTRPTYRRARTAPPEHLQQPCRDPPREGARADSPFPTLQLEGQPMLSVDIPGAQFDRYSVMFSGLLKPTPPPSLLVRRQGHLENVQVDGRVGQV